MQIKVNIRNISGASNSEIAKIQAAGLLLEKVVNSQDFKDMVLAHKYGFYIKTGWFSKKRIETLGFYHPVKTVTGAEILKRFEDGSEITEVNVDNEIDLDLNLYSKWGKVVGYTTPWASLKIWMNKSFFTSFDLSDVVGNLAHEFTHQLGFYHEGSSGYWEGDPAYGVGEIASECARRILKS